MLTSVVGRGFFIVIIKAHLVQSVAE